MTLDPRVRTVLGLVAAGAIALSPGCDGGGGGDGDGGARDGSASACTGASDCDDGQYCNGAEVCDSAAGCVSGDPPCGAGMLCDEDSDACSVDACADGDADGDGYDSVACGGADCDDDDAGAYPGNAEVCDVLNHDEDCDPRTFGYRDQDGDGRPDAACCNGDTCGTDCDDTDPTVGMDGEYCDGRDNDCNGVVDDLPGGGSCSCTVNGETRDCGPDRALDGVGLCVTGTETCAAGTWVCAGAVSPAADELCNTLDDDCDGSTDEGFDCEQGTTVACSDVTDSASFPGVTRTCATEGSTTCTALCEAGTCLAATEDCDYCDDDGDGLDDELGMADIDINRNISTTGCTALSRNATCNDVLVASSGTGGLFFSNPITLGYGPLDIRVNLDFDGACDADAAVVVYRYSSRGYALGPGIGVDTDETGASVELYLGDSAAGLRASVVQRHLPSGVTGGGPPDGVPVSCGQFVSVRLVVQPHTPIGAAGVTTYTHTVWPFGVDEADGTTESREGPDLYPGDRVVVGVVGMASSSRTEVPLFFANTNNSCTADPPVRGG